MPVHFVTAFPTAAALHAMYSHPCFSLDSRFWPQSRADDWHCPHKSHDAQPGLSAPVLLRECDKSSKSCTQFPTNLSEPHRTLLKSCKRYKHHRNTANGSFFSNLGACFIYRCSTLHYLWLISVLALTHGLRISTYAALSLILCDSKGSEYSFLMSPLIPFSICTQQSVADLHSRFIREEGGERAKIKGGARVYAHMRAYTHLCIIGGVTSVST